MPNQVDNEAYLTNVDLLWNLPLLGKIKTILKFLAYFSWLCMSIMCEIVDSCSFQSQANVQLPISQRLT